MPSLPAVPAELAGAVESLRTDLSGIFGPRLNALVAYGARLFPSPATVPSALKVRLNTLALVDTVRVEDLQACAGRADAWLRSGLRIPLLLGHGEFVRSLDVFPFEYGDIIARHVRVSGEDPFAGLAVLQTDLRRAAEQQAKSHVIHLRGGFVETCGRGGEIADLLRASAVAFATLLGHIVRLRRRDDSTLESLAAGVQDIPGVLVQVCRDVLSLVHDPTIADDDARRLYPGYLETVTGLVHWLDQWAPDGPTR
jgi:hypothetical protein